MWIDHVSTFHNSKERRQGAPLLQRCRKRSFGPCARPHQRTLLYLGEINSDQQAAWAKAIGVLDKLLEHRDALFTHLQSRWKDLFGVKYEVLLYDLTSTSFEGQAEENPKAQRGYSRDHRPDCKQVVIARVGTPRSRIQETRPIWETLAWEKIRDTVHVKSFTHSDELYVVAKSAKRFVTIELPKEEEELSGQIFRFKLDKEKLKDAELYDGHYLLRSNLSNKEPKMGSNYSWRG